jgi:catechol 2,3-dioxygenase-like lactoylglutathione lyase family enzyme
MQLLVNIDVPDLTRAIAFYEAALGLREVRRLDDAIAELAGGPCPIFLLSKPAGSAATAETGPNAPTRNYVRHWTPVHLDFVVDDLDAAVERARGAGAIAKRAPSSHVWGRMALLADPFGHGLCLLEFRGRGYDELPWVPAARRA